MVLNVVSILVLVDVGLRQPRLFLPAKDLSGFNPCFSGCWSSTQVEKYCVAQTMVVSILVLVDVGLRPAALTLGMLL